MKNKLNSKKIINVLEENKDKIQKAGVKKIGLFGSYAKGKEKKNSDIDFLIEFESVDFDKYFFMLKLLEKLFQKKVDLVIEKDLKPELKYVKKEAEYVRI
ncbi:MAG: nucleotidyltransferase domain-containing protein [Nanoarchaeota archaeon]|nr:nucleotidyltransferase domain-containing protein [Nanoarchaeota archaeon]